MYTQQLQNAAEIAVTTLVAIMQTGKSEHARVAACRLVLQMAARATVDGRPPGTRGAGGADGGPVTADRGRKTDDYRASKDDGQPLNGRATALAGMTPSNTPTSVPPTHCAGARPSAVGSPPSAVAPALVPAPRTARSELQAVREAGEILERCMALMEDPPKKPAPLAKMPLGRRR